MRLLGHVNPTMREVVEMLYEFEEPLLLDASRYAATFGDEVTPLREGIRATLAWYRGERPLGEVAAPRGSQGADGP